jgi:predicted ATPase
MHATTTIAATPATVFPAPRPTPGAQPAAPTDRSGVMPARQDHSTSDDPGVIFTPDQRVRVFISSTLEELATERTAARRAIQRLYLTPVWYESSARPHPPRRMYHAYLEQSHIFVGIYWQRYGWVAPNMSVSGLEDEYILAADKPKLIYLKRPAPDQEPRLKAFIEEIRAEGTVSYRAFSTPRQLEPLLADDLALLLSESFDGGTRTAAGKPGASSVKKPATPAAAPPAAGNLPLQLTSFVGRADAMAEVRAAVERSRLVTLTGVGGVGKTRLAVEVAACLESGYPDGCWLCELAPTTDPGTVTRIVATTLGITPRQGLSLEESIIDHARAKRMLVLLDNCEHVLDAAGRLVETLLQNCPDIRVLTTSRQELAVGGEQVVRLGPLYVAGASAPADTIAGSDGVRLFVDRAVAVRHEFALGPDDALTVAEICRRLDGIPLAIELAAARVESMSPTEIAGMLDERFELLTKGRRSAAARHQTLRVVVDWSYSLLASDERLCFARLGVFGGTFDIEAALAVVDADVDAWHMRDMVASLVDKSMVVREDGPGGTTRYRMLETLRHYARGRLQEGDDPDARHRLHAQYFAEFTERAAAALYGHDELRWRARVRAELDNLRGAVQWALGASLEDGELAVRIAASLANYAVFEAAGDIASLVERAENRARLSAPGRRCAVLGASAFAAFQNDGDLERAGGSVRRGPTRWGAARLSGPPAGLRDHGHGAHLDRAPRRGARVV